MAMPERVAFSDAERSTKRRKRRARRKDANREGATRGGDDQAVGLPANGSRDSLGHLRKKRMRQAGNHQAMVQVRPVISARAAKFG